MTVRLAPLLIVTVLPLMENPCPLAVVLAVAFMVTAPAMVTVLVRMRIPFAPVPENANVPDPELVKVLVVLLKKMASSATVVPVIDRLPLLSVILVVLV